MDIKKENMFDSCIKQCEECGEVVEQEYGSGDDEYGEFSDYECGHCYSLTRFYLERC